MSKNRLAGVSVVLLVSVGAALSQAENISTKALVIKDSAKPAKRLAQAQSRDPGVQFSEAGDPATDGAAIHFYSATDDFCVLLPGGTGWVNKKGKTWKYTNKATKNAALISNGKLSVRIKSPVTFSLLDNGKQNAVNVQVQFGAGTRYCMRCSAAKKNTAALFSAKNCAAAACDPEPSPCGTVGTTTTITTTTSSPGSTTSTTTGTPLCTPAGMVAKGTLTATPGRFNYNLMLGLPGANSACNTNFPGTHVCTYAELQSAAAACDLRGLKDPGNNSVTSFWAIDSSQPALQQCNDDAAGGSGLNWEYATAHTASRGQRVALDNAAGTLGTLQSGVQCNIAGNSWVACCQ